MGDFNIQVEAPAAELNQELIAEVELADLEPEDANAAYYGVRAALTFLDVVGDHSVDAGVEVGIEGETGKNIMVSVVAVPASETVEPINIPVDEEVLEVEEEIALAMVGQHANPETGDPLVDNVPGHPEAEWEPSTPSPAVVEEPDEELDREEQDNQMAGLEPADVEDVENRPAPAPDFKGMTIEQVLETVGDDRQLAEDALESEEANARPRPTLITQLEDIIDEGGA